jgi:pimeloyl-ACP methyl ester carboxylesterase
MISHMYPAQRIARSEFVPIRQLNYHVRCWGQPGPDKTPWVLLHGWMDVAASFQFVVDALTQDHFIIAPDWRGFGLTRSGGADTFWFPDYLADLDALLDHYAPGQSVNLVGHSMGGNVAMIYAGVRPGRIRRLVNLEGFGMPASRPEHAAGRFAQWMNEIKQLNSGMLQLKTYTSLDAVAARLMKTNQRLSADKARWLASHWSSELMPGQWSILGEAAHKITSAQLYRVDEVLAIFRNIKAPTLMVEAEDDSMALWWKGKFTKAEHRQRMNSVANLEIVQVPDCGHMLHHDQPLAVAALIEGYLSASQTDSVI